jgi:hypothetical protein
MQMSAFYPKADTRGTSAGLVRFTDVKSDADPFRKRAKECRDVANGTRDSEAQRELRALAEELDSEADQITDEEGRESQSCLAE